MSEHNKVVSFTKKQNKKGSFIQKVIKNKLFMIILAILICGYFYFNYITYRECTIVKNIQSPIMRTNVIDFQGGSLIYNNEGAMFENKQGKILWNNTYTIDSPKALACDNYVAIVDVKGTVIEVFDVSGRTYTITTEYPILDIEDINSSGYITVILQGGISNYILIYEKTKKIREIKTTLEGQGFPITASLSNDGKKLAVSYLYTKGTTVESRIGFYNFGEIGENQEDKLIASFKYEQTIFAELKFLTKNTICAFGDNKLVFFEVKNRPDIKKEIKMDAEIKSIFYYSNKVGIIVNNTKKENGAKYRLKLYSKSGRCIKDFTLDHEYNSVVANKKSIVLMGNKTSAVYTTSGRLKFCYDFREQPLNITDSGIGHYAVVFVKKTQLVRVKF